MSPIGYPYSEIESKKAGRISVLSESEIAEMRLVSKVSSMLVLQVMHYSWYLVSTRLMCFVCVCTCTFIIRGRGRYAPVPSL